MFFTVLCRAVRSCSVCFLLSEPLRCLRFLEKIFLLSKKLLNIQECITLSWQDPQFPFQISDLQKITA